MVLVDMFSCDQIPIENSGCFIRKVVTHLFWAVGREDHTYYEPHLNTYARIIFMFIEPLL